MRFAYFSLPLEYSGSARDQCIDWRYFDSVNLAGFVISAFLSKRADK